MIKLHLERLARKSHSHDGGKANQGEKSYMWACGVDKDHCQGKHNGKLNTVVHGSKDAATRCIKAYFRWKEANQ